MMRKRPPGRSPTGRRLRFDKGQRQLTRRDVDVLQLIGEQYTYRFDQLQGVLARHPDSHSADPASLSETRTRAAIQKWEQLGLARSRKIFHEQPAFVWLTPRGLRQAGLDVEPWEPPNNSLDHPCWINEVRARIDGRAATHPDRFQHYHWESERLWWSRRNRLLKEHKANAALEIPRSYQCLHRPDAVVHFVRDSIQHHIVIEVQLSVKTEGWFAHTWNALLWHHSSVWYYVSAEVKKPLLEMLQAWQQENPGYQDVPAHARQHIYVYDLELFL